MAAVPSFRKRWPLLLCALYVVSCVGGAESKSLAPRLQHLRGGADGSGRDSDHAGSTSSGSLRELRRLLHTLEEAVARLAERRGQEDGQEVGPLLADPALGDRVMVQPSVARPRYEWGGVPPETVGTLVELSAETDDCLIDFPQYPRWHGHLAELQRVTAAADVPRVGDAVRLRRSAGPATPWPAAEEAAPGDEAREKATGGRLSGADRAAVAEVLAAYQRMRRRQEQGVAGGVVGRVVEVFVDDEGMVDMCWLEEVAARKKARGGGSAVGDVPRAGGRGPRAVATASLSAVSSPAPPRRWLARLDQLEVVNATTGLPLLRSSAEAGAEAEGGSAGEGGESARGGVRGVGASEPKRGGLPWLAEGEENASAAARGGAGRFGGKGGGSSVGVASLGGGRFALSPAALLGFTLGMSVARGGGGAGGGRAGTRGLGGLFARAGGKAGAAPDPKSPEAKAARERRAASRPGARALLALRQFVLGQLLSYAGLM